MKMIRQMQESTKDQNENCTRKCNKTKMTKIRQKVQQDKNDLINWKNDVMRQN